jgi:hypothetical protein
MVFFAYDLWPAFLLSYRIFLRNELDGYFAFTKDSLINIATTAVLRISCCIRYKIVASVSYPNRTELFLCTAKPNESSPSYSILVIFSISLSHG